MIDNRNYDWLLQTRTGSKWSRIGTGRRAGVCVPLFSVYSDKSTGIGEIPDIRLLIEWCRNSGMSVIQLLPLNDTGFDFSPYNAVSTFALDPVYLSLRSLRDADVSSFRKQLTRLRRSFPAGGGRVNYGIKSAKLELLKQMFATAGKDSESYLSFRESNLHWLRYYGMFRVLTDMNNNTEWSQWEMMYRYLSPSSLLRLSELRSDELEFHYWVQWQLYEQLKEIKDFAAEKGVLLMGDLPFLVSRNSADVWAYKNYFKLGLSSGAPPDMYFARGQKWGMPPYDWENIRADSFGYIRARLRYAENFYDMFRIDHFVGLFRVWTVDAESPAEEGSSHGAFDPPYEHLWNDHGREITNVMNESTSMLPCAEDLGTVPECSNRTLKEFGITGINVQRWEKKWSGFSVFTDAGEYRQNSNAVISTHDSSSFPEWFEKEAGTVGSDEFDIICKAKGYSEAEIQKLRNELFEEPEYGRARLRWKATVSNVYLLTEKFPSGHDELQDVISMYLSSFNEREIFLRYLKHNRKTSVTTAALVRKNIRKIFDSASIFSIQLMSEFLFLDKEFLEKNKFMRINSPGTMGPENWSAVIPVSINTLLKNDSAKEIRKIVDSSGRQL